MRGGSYYQPRGVSASGTAYADAFLRKAHKLVGQGYSALRTRAFVRADEEDITGELVRAIETVLDEAGAPRWMRWFSVHEDSPLHDDIRKGKRRRRIDVRIDCSELRPRTRLRFEAKRLDLNHGTSVYLGSDGVQRFLDGRRGRGDDVAGMLGYVQSGHPDEWAAKIEQAMNRDAAKLYLRKSGRWRRAWLAVEPSSTYRSDHNRPNVGRPIEILHTLLLFN